MDRRLWPGAFRSIAHAEARSIDRAESLKVARPKSAARQPLLSDRIAAVQDWQLLPAAAARRMKFGCLRAVPVDRHRRLQNRRLLPDSCDRYQQAAQCSRQQKPSTPVRSDHRAKVSLSPFRCQALHARRCGNGDSRKLHSARSLASRSWKTASRIRQSHPDRLGLPGKTGRAASGCWAPIRLAQE
jgi:hypothetical protein